jgi:ribosomal protein S6--L-glutamate ligase
MIVSFHPRVHGDVNLRVTSRDLFSEQEAKTIASARGVVVTQHIKPYQYQFCMARCPHVFPDYTHRFGFEGKYGNIQLFRKFNASHPESACYKSVEDFKARHLNNREPLMPFPFVLKGDRGGGGWAVFLVTNERELIERLEILRNTRLHATRRFIAQAFVPHGGRDLRVVAIGKIMKAYWRCQHKPGEFRNNVGRGAVINYDLDPELMKKGIRCVTDFSSKTGINLAAFDVLFDQSQPEPQPLLSEINFLFGRKGLGGSRRFYEFLNRAVQDWIRDLSDPITNSTFKRLVRNRFNLLDLH